MKKILTLTLCLLTMTGMFANANGDNEEKAKTVAAIKSLNFRVDINTILGSGMTIQDSGSYFLEIKDGRVKSYMPFIGESHGGSTMGDQSLSFDEPVNVKVDKSKAAKEGLYTLTFTAKANSGKWEVRIEAYDSGSVTITCNSSTKTPMTYWGDIDI